MTTEIRDWAVVTADIEANGAKTVDRMPTNFLQNLVSIFNLNHFLSRLNTK